MMRSLFSGVAGLKNHQTRMDVTGNNIANVNTIGYKSGRTTFQDMLSQSIKGAAGPTGNIGGVNPLQVGLGMGVASVDNIFTTGSMQNTGKNTDLAIDGDGFFMVQNGLQTYYTRAGNFDFDSVGNYVIPGTGLQVMGWIADNSGNIVNSTTPVPLTIPLNQAMPPKTTTEIGFEGNLFNSSVIGVPASAGPPAVAEIIAEQKITSKEIYDSLGTEYQATIVFERTGVDTWEYTVKVVDKNDIDPDTKQPRVLAVVPDTSTTPGTLEFDTNGTLLSFDPDPAEYTITTVNGSDPIMPVTLDFSKMTQYGIESNLVAKTQNGYTAGTLDRATLQVDSSGVISGQFSNGQIMNLGQVALAVFTNPGGLTKVGSSLFSESNNSGVARVGIAGDGGFGAVKPSTLEMANVDLSEEFTAMITTQRGFQANSRIITTSDSMLEELVNLKR